MSFSFHSPPVKAHNGPGTRPKTLNSKLRPGPMSGRPVRGGPVPSSPPNDDSDRALVALHPEFFTTPHRGIPSMAQ